MSRKIIGITVGTPMNPEKIASPSDEQVKNAVDKYLEENPIEEGFFSDEKIAEAVNTYMEENPIKGEKGDPGETGPQGEKGDKGDPGVQGEKGETGHTGATGPAGKDGVSVTHSWNGTTLSVTSASGTTSMDLKGEKGEKGDTGPKGDTGSQGPKGDQGIQGETGPKGDKGDTGATGATGSQGPQGEKGPKGDTGPAGSDANVTAENIKNALGYTPIKESDVNPLHGKNVSFIGDSICAGSENTYVGGYGKIIADRNNMTYENLAKGGSTITAETYSHSTGDAKMWISRKVDEMNINSDYIIVEGGVNDAWQFVDYGDIEIGEITDGFNAELDDTTYYGAFESMLKKLITRFPGKKIGYIAIPKTMGLYDSSRNVPNFYHIALECCAKWGIPVCDLNTIIPPFDFLGTEYTSDGTHPTYEGYIKYYCDPIETWMKTLTTGGNNTASVAIKAIEEYTKGFNDAIKALQDGKLNNTGISFRKALLPLADGTTIEIDVLTALDGSVVIPYINRVPLSIDTDGSVFNGVGYKEDLRLSSSGVAKSQLGSYVTGFIPAKNGDVIRVFGCDWGTTLAATNYICAYDSNFTFIGARATVQGSNSLTGHGTTIISSASDYSIDDDLNLTMTLNCTDTIAYIRVSSRGNTTENQATFDPKDMIVTVNEEIK